jgi:fructose-bisphosphate aldolase class II
VAIVSLSDLFERARRHGYAVGYFEGWDQHSLEAILEAAEEVAAPVVLGFGGAVVSQPWLDGGGLEELAALCRCLAERATVPTAILLNEARSFGQVQRGLRAGCNAVMIESSHLSFDENVTLNRRVVEVAHRLGAVVEGELGHLANAGGGTEEAIHTDPAEAARFVESTGVDALAVSVGNVHLLSNGQARVDLDLLQRLHHAVSVPLVIHGGTSFPSWAVPRAIERGVAKFNVGTRLKQAFLAGMREALTALPEPVDPHLAMGSHEKGDVFAYGKARMKQEIVALMKQYGCAGQALVRK